MAAIIQAASNALTAAIKSKTSASLREEIVKLRARLVEREAAVKEAIEARDGAAFGGDTDSERARERVRMLEDEVKTLKGQIAEGVRREHKIRGDEFAKATRVAFVEERDDWSLINKRAAELAGLLKKVLDRQLEYKSMQKFLLSQNRKDESLSRPLTVAVRLHRDKDGNEFKGSVELLKGNFSVGIDYATSAVAGLLETLGKIEPDAARLHSSADADAA